MNLSMLYVITHARPATVRDISVTERYAQCAEVQVAEIKSIVSQLVDLVVNLN